MSGYRVLLLTLIVSTQSACGPDKAEVNALYAQLELAELQTDLPTMFTVLRHLDSIGALTDSTRSQLSTISSTLASVEQMELAVGDHNHEIAAIEASKILRSFPRHQQARKTLVESGLIFSYLEDARLRLNSIFTESESDTLFSLVCRVDEPGEIDLGRIVTELAEARHSADKATALDPSFVRALELQRSINDVSDTITLLTCEAVATETSGIVDAYYSLYANIYNTMSAGLGLLSPSQVWSIFSPRIEKLEGAKQRALDALNEHVRLLPTDPSGAQVRMVESAREMAALVPVFVDEVTSPKGSMIDYKRDVGDCHAKVRAMASTFNSTLPTSNEIGNRVAGFARAARAFHIYENPTPTKAALDEFSDLFSGA